MTDSATQVKDHIDVGHAALLDAIQNPGPKAAGKAFTSMNAPESWHNSYFLEIYLTDEIPADRIPNG